MLIEPLLSFTRLLFFLDKLGAGDGDDDIAVGLKIAFYFVTFKVTKILISASSLARASY